MDDNNNLKNILTDSNQWYIQEYNSIYEYFDCELKFVKTHPDAKMPTKAHDEDNCWDLYAVEGVEIPGSVAFPTKWNSVVGSYDVEIGNAVVPVGLSVGHISPGFGFVIRPRSGLGFKFGIQPHFGEIDNGYRGDLGIKCYNLTSSPYYVNKGDKIAQIKVERVYKTKVEFVDSATDSTRGEKGFGSSGK